MISDGFVFVLVSSEGPLSVAEIFNRIPIEDTRNFCFIAHVDHGKSSLGKCVSLECKFRLRKFLFICAIMYLFPK